MMHFSNNFVMGKCTFRLTSRHEQLLQSICGLLLPADKLHRLSSEEEAHGVSRAMPGSAPAAAEKEECCCPTINLDNLDMAVDKKRLDHTRLVYHTMDRLRVELYHMQHDCIALDAAALVAPASDSQSPLVLLAGVSGAGKTTLTVSMAVLHDWKVLAEDITFIDIESAAVYPVRHPFSMRPSWRETISEATDTLLPPYLVDDWYFDRNVFSNAVVAGNFSLLVKLEPPHSATPLSVTAVSPGEYLRQILPLGNVLRLPSGAVDILANAFAHADCHIIQGGTVSERAEALLALTKNAEPKGGLCNKLPSSSEARQSK